MELFKRKNRFDIILFGMTSQSIDKEYPMRQLYIERNRHDVVEAIRGRYQVLGHKLSFCSYVVDGLMIDSGPVKARKAVLRFTEEVKPCMLTLTHHHEDHAGNIQMLHQWHQAPIYLTQPTAEILKHGLQIAYYRRLSYGPSLEPITGIVLGRDRIETERFEFQLIHTPGHTEDHYCFYEPKQGWLFSGDLYLAPKLNYGIRGESMPKLIQSLRNILKYSCDVLFCGHAGIVHNPVPLLQRKLNYLEELQGKVQELLQKGMNPQQIAKELLPMNRFMELISNRELSPVYLIQSFVEENQFSSSTVNKM